MPLVIKIIAFFLWIIMKISQKNWKFEILQRFLVFSTLYWILLKFSAYKLTQIPQGESKTLEKEKEGKKSKKILEFFEKK